MHIANWIYFLVGFPFLFLTAHTQQVMTISDSIVDYILFVDDEFIEKVPGTKGGSALVDHSTLLNILAESRVKPSLVPGGSAVNMLKSLSHFGHHCTLIASVGDDEAGSFFLNRLKEKGIELLVKTVSSPTGSSLSLVTPDGERTMRTYLGASAANANIDLDSISFGELTLFHLEGYQLKYKELVKKALANARKAGAIVSLDLSSFEIVRAEYDFIWELLQDKQIDLLFANHDEACVLTGLSAQESVNMLTNYTQAVVVTMGEKGCLACSGEEKIHYPAFSVRAIDTTGAGDLFVGGFLHGFLSGWGLEKCAQMGTLLASQVIQVIGAEIPPERWELIEKEIGSIQQHSQEEERWGKVS